MYFFKIFIRQLDTISYLPLSLVIFTSFLMRFSTLGFTLTHFLLSALTFFTTFA